MKEIKTGQYWEDEIGRVWKIIKIDAKLVHAHIRNNPGITWAFSHAELKWDIQMNRMKEWKIGK